MVANMNLSNKEIHGNEQKPHALNNPEYHYDAFENGRVLLGKKKCHLPAMGWNSWNAFGSGNTEALTRAMADKIVELGLDKLGYRYVVLDDGCYRPVRLDGRLANEEIKFPNGFKALSDYLHSRGLKFGMYNDIGTNLCAGAAVGTCGHEADDAQSYAEWGVDFLKVDNCYYPWDNATFSDAANARYVFAPNIRSVAVSGLGLNIRLSAVESGIIQGSGVKAEKDYLTHIGTLDGTGPLHSPMGKVSGEVCFPVQVPESGDYELFVEYATGEEEGVGSWLQVAVGEEEDCTLFFDDFLPKTAAKESFSISPPIRLALKKGGNLIRLMNHRRQENTLNSYALLLEGLNKAAPGHDIIYSICEWGKTQPQSWGYKVGDSWRILNDITFRVGSDGDPGYGSWTDEYTPSVTSQYNKAVIMDEYSGLDKGWNDPDMLMVGMNGLTETMQRTHMTMWCMMNSPLMLGLDLRRVEKGDIIYEIIANERLILLNRDPLGIQAKRIFSTAAVSRPDSEYLRDNKRVDILAKPLADGSVALSFINLCEECYRGNTWAGAAMDTGSPTDQNAEGLAATAEQRAVELSVSIADIIKYIGSRMVDRDRFEAAGEYLITDLWSGEMTGNRTGIFTVNELEACGNVTIKIEPQNQKHKNRTIIPER